MTDERQAYIEWRAWGAVVVELEALGINVNVAAKSGLVRALVRWGEELAALRNLQDIRSVREPVLKEAREAYPKLPAIAANGRWSHQVSEVIP